MRCHVLAAAVGAALALAGPSIAAAEVVRYAVIVGHNQGDGDQEQLRYAEDDAEKMEDVLRDLGGFRSENLVLLRGDDADTTRRALIAMNDRIRSNTSDALLFVYYSGHADAEALQLGASRLDLGELEQLVRGSPAAMRLLVLDACRSGALTRVKGGRTVEAFQLSLDERLAGEGVVFLTASAASEDAQESDELKGSFFTHYLVSGLLGAGDTDGDGRVSLEEAYRYAYQNTVRASSRTLAGAQHPTFSYDMKGQGGLTLTALAGNQGKRARLALPDTETWLLLAGHADGGVVAEIGRHDAVRTLSVRPGTYFVRGRTTDHLLEGTIKLAAGDQVTVDPEELDRIEFARLVRKGGGGVRRRAFSAVGGFRVRSGLWTGASPCAGPVVGFGVDLPRWSASARIGGCRGGYSNQSLSADTDEVDVELRLGHATDRGRVALDIGVTTGVALLRERYDTRGVAPPNLSGAAELGVTTGVAVDLRRGLFVAADLGAQTYFFREQATGGSPGWVARFTVRGALGVGTRW